LLAPMLGPAGSSSLITITSMSAVSAGNPHS
jgi:hypothetical protein